jgi:predicted nucleic acid-binding protein
VARRLILDSGAVIALAAGEPAALVVVAAAVADGAPVIIPAPVVAETTRGTNADAPVNRVIRRATGGVAPVDERVARLAGRLLRGLGDGRAAHAPPTVDALVVAVALAAGGGTILTGDRADLGALAADHPQVRILALADI